MINDTSVDAGSGGWHLDGHFGEIQSMMTVEAKDTLVVNMT